jgi:hypothetical protein
MINGKTVQQACKNVLSSFSHCIGSDSAFSNEGFGRFMIHTGETPDLAEELLQKRWCHCCPRNRNGGAMSQNHSLD